MAKHPLLCHLRRNLDQPNSDATNPASGPRAQPHLGGLPAVHPADGALLGAGLKIPDHELIRPIDHGACGQVWLARNVVGTLRAIKIIFRSQWEDDRPYEREFIGIKKFEPVSRSHDGLIDILQIGRDDQAGYFYYVMELADDLSAECEVQPAGSCQTVPRCAPDQYAAKTLRAELRRRSRLPVAECTTVGLALTSALEHLHKHGLVHRDIKPSNIIFVNGVPKLADIGLVADLGESKSFVGTLGYIPPEGPGTPQADLYGLGKVFYEMSTGRDRQDFPQLPTDLRECADSGALVEFNEILLKACDSEPSRRYQSAEEMQAELELLRRGRSLKRRRNWSKALAVGKKAGAWAGLAGAVTTAALLLASSLSERDMRSAVPEVNKLVEQGTFVVRRHDKQQTLRAADLFQRAIGLDPSFVPAHFGLFLTYVSRGAFEPDASPELRSGLEAVAARLLRIAPNLSESRHVSAFVKWINWRFPEALADMHAATHMRASCKVSRADAHTFYGFLLLQSGKPAEALVEYRKAEQLDAANPTIQHHLGHPYFAQGDFKRALAQYQKSFEIEPSHNTGHYWAGRVYEETGDFMDAIREFETRDRMVSGESAEAKRFYDDLREAVRQGGGKGYWHRRLELALANSPPDYYDIATYYARLGPKEKAYEWLKKACEKRAFNQGLLFDLCWDHNDLEFQAIARGIGLLQ